MTAPFLDTNIVIDWLLRRGGAVSEMKRYVRHRISRVVWAELLAGEAGDTRSGLESLLGRRFEIVEIDAEIAAVAADVRYRTRVKLLDALIYATARHHDAVLITRNTKDFPPGTLGIRIPYTL